MVLEFGNFWTAGAFLIALQIGAFTWRINREINESEKGAINWMPWADIVNLIAIAIAFMGIFLLPIIGLISPKILKIALGLAIILFTGYPFALAGHYELFTKGKRSMEYFPIQEKIAILITSVVAIFFVVLSLCIKI